MPKANVNGIELHYEEQGSGEPILLIMGLATQLIAWPPAFVAGLVERGYHVICFDNRDIGLSMKIDAPAPEPRAIVRGLASKRLAKADYLLADMADEDRQMFLSEMGQTEPGLNRLIRAAFSLLGLQTYFTAGVKEVRAWTVRIGARAPEAAGVIHTDFQKGFIRAEVIAYADFVQYKGEQGAKDAGKWRLEGKEYVVQDGDVIHFRFNV